MKNIDYRFVQFHILYINFNNAVNCRSIVEKKSISDDIYDYAIQYNQITRKELVVNMIKNAVIDLIRKGYY